MAEDLAQSYAGLMIQIGQDAQYLAKQGRALALLGPIAPPCLVHPYKEQREKTIRVASRLFDAFKDQFGVEAHDTLSGGAGPFRELVDSMPDLIGSWSDAPAVWQPEAYAGPEDREVVVPPLGKLGATDLYTFLQKALYSMDPRGFLPEVMGSTEEVAGSVLWRGIWKAGPQILKFAAKRVIPVWIVLDLVWSRVAGPSTSDTLGSLMRQVPQDSSALAAIREVVESFESDYLPKTAQQWQAVIKIARVSAGNPTVMKQYMLAYDPHVERPMPPPPTAFDAISMALLAGIKFRGENRYSWLGIPVLVTGSLTTMYGLGEG